VTGSRLDELVTYLAEALARLAAAGAEVALLASNTPHLVFDELRRRSPMPLISIVEAACAATRAMGFTRVALFGTRFTMEARFYPDVFAAAGIALMVPSADEREYIHGCYMDELIHGRFLPQTREAMAAIAERMVAHDAVQAVVLGGTELPPAVSRRSAAARAAARYHADPRRARGGGDARRCARALRGRNDFDRCDGAAYR
jgi:aspartate racemase